MVCHWGSVANHQISLSLIFCWFFALNQGWLTGVECGACRGSGEVCNRSATRALPWDNHRTRTSNNSWYIYISNHYNFLVSSFFLISIFHIWAKIHFMVLTILKFQKLFWNIRFLIFPKKVTEISAMCSIPKPHQPPQEPYFDISILLYQNETILRKC